MVLLTHTVSDQLGSQIKGSDEMGHIGTSGRLTAFCSTVGLSVLVHVVVSVAVESPTDGPDPDSSALTDRVVECEKGEIGWQTGG